MKMVNAKGEAVYFNRAWKHGKETWVVLLAAEPLCVVEVEPPGSALEPADDHGGGALTVGAFPAPPLPGQRKTESRHRWSHQ